MRRFPRFGYGMNTLDYMKTMRETFSQEICEAPITCARIPAFQIDDVTYMGSALTSSKHVPLVFDRDNGRFQPAKAKDESQLCS